MTLLEKTQRFSSCLPVIFVVVLQYIVCWSMNGIFVFMVFRFMFAYDGHSRVCHTICGEHCVLTYVLKVLK